MRAAMLMMLLCVAISLNFNASVVAQENTQYVYHLSPSTHSTLRHITVWLDQSTENNPELITYEKKPSSVSEPGIPVLSYFTIYSDAQIQKIEVEFAISYSWLDQNNVPENEIVLLKFDNRWIEYPAQLVDNDESYVYFKSDAPGVSIFAIAAHPSSSTGILLPATLITIAVLASSVVYWFLIRPKKSFISLKRLKKGAGLPVIKDKEAIVSLKKPPEVEQPSKLEKDVKSFDREKDLEALRKLQRKSGGKKNG